MNYIELELGGKKRGAKLGLLFLENAQKSENKNIQELFEELMQRSIFYAPKLIYHALVTNCQIKGETVDFTLENVYDWVEESGLQGEKNQVAIFVQAFADNVTKLFPSEESEGKKKPLKKEVSTASGGNGK